MNNKSKHAKMQYKYNYTNIRTQILLRPTTRDVNEAMLYMRSLRLGLIKFGSCTTQLLNELFVDTKNIFDY